MKKPRRSQPGRRVQLHRALSKLGWGSRTQAWERICAGEVRVDGLVVTDPLTWVDLEHQDVTRFGDNLPQPDRVVIALHKPASSRRAATSAAGGPFTTCCPPTCPGSSRPGGSTWTRRAC